mmetsp:Transcript_26660/g.58588  ORF Transcript_26660/g.58588 Transcript_26660/m.58588 type:complete len:588 (-) Transcript_26660:362-2125(-)
MAESDGKESKGYGMSWTNLTHVVKLRDGTSKTIVDNVFGSCRPGSMMAIMGPSGGGKTSLLDLLGDRIKSGTTTGVISIGGRARDAASARKVVSYVMQEDSLLSCFTVKETLRYTARLVLASLGTKGREERIEAAMVSMGLTNCANTRVGDPLIKGISGGQKRRLSIAIELLQQSPILLLDEPTSGLDSASASSVVEHLKVVSEKGTLIIASIHQPSTSTFNKFNLVCLLTSGKLAYFGPTGTDAIDFFAANGFQCPAYTNPAEFYLDILNVDFSKDQNDKDKLMKLVEAFASSSVAEQVQAQGIAQNDPSNYEFFGGKAGFFIQFWVLLRRTLHMSWKNPYIFLVRIVMYTALAFMVGTMYWEKGDEAKYDGSAAQSVVAALFYVQAFLVFMAVAILPFFLEIRDVFRRERANGQITVLPYVLADFFANLPGVALTAVISSLLCVYLASLNGFGGFFLNLLLSLVVAESLMKVIGAAQPHYIIGMAFGAGLFGMFMLCEGFMVPFSSIPDGWKWGYYMAFHTYSFEWFMHNQFSGDEAGFIGNSILSYYDMQNVDPVRNTCILLGYALLFQIAYFVVLYVFHTGRR